jgi:hypothetical protein
MKRINEWLQKYNRFTPLPDEYALRSKADQGVFGVVYPALRLGGEDTLLAQVAGVDAEGLPDDEPGWRGNQLGGTLQQRSPGGGLIRGRRTAAIDDHGAARVEPQLLELARAAEAADPEAFAIPEKPDGDDVGLKRTKYFIN